MFPSIQQILDEADELADRCEAYEPSTDDERPVAEYLLKRAASQKARCEHQIAQAVVAARADGSSWNDIRRILGASDETASQQHQVVEESTRASDAGPGASVRVWGLLIERSLDTGADLSLYWQELDARRTARRHMESDWPVEAGPMPNDVYAAIELFNSYRHGDEHIWLGASPIRATADEEPGDCKYKEPQKCEKIWRRDFVREDLASSSEWSEIQEIATSLVDHMNGPDVYNELRRANVPGSKSQEIQAIIKEKTAELGFRDESKGLFAGYRTRGLTPDYYREVGCTGVILEVERGKTINNNMDFLDFWKCHICRVASFLILIVPVELRHNEEDRPTRAFHAASNRLESFFIAENYTNVWGLVLLGY
jgi:hypothetical protein